MSKNTGGPAFPVSEVSNRHGDTIQYPSEGMTLRDYFAAKAMQGMICAASEQNADSTAPDLFSAIAMDSYSYADAMLKAREA